MLLAAAISAALLSQARTHIAEASVDPAGVQFRGTTVFEGVALADWGRQTVVCMEANLPNRSGGRDGFKPAAFVSPANWGVVTGLDETFIKPDGTATSIGASERLSAAEDEPVEKRARLAAQAMQLRAAYPVLAKLCGRSN